MTFCTECGQDHHADEREAEAEVKRAADAEVEIERLRTRRDIEVARISAGAATDIAAEESDAELAHAEGQAEGMREVIEAASPDPAPAADPEPLVLEAPEAEPAAEDAPPKVDENEHHEPPAPERKRGFF